VKTSTFAKRPRNRKTAVPQGQWAQWPKRPLICVMRLIPTGGGNPGPYNGRAYDGLYLLKGGGKQAWKLSPRIIKQWRKPQGVIFGKRCGCSQNLGRTARDRAGYSGESDLWQRARELGLQLR